LPPLMPLQAWRHAHAAEVAREAIAALSAIATAAVHAEASVHAAQASANAAITANHDPQTREDHTPAVQDDVVDVEMSGVEEPPVAAVTETGDVEVAEVAEIEEVAEVEEIEEISDTAANKIADEVVKARSADVTPAEITPIEVAPAQQVSETVDATPPPAELARGIAPLVETAEPAAPAVAAAAPVPAATPATPATSAPASHPPEPVLLAAAPGTALSIPPVQTIPEPVFPDPDIQTVEGNAGDAPRARRVRDPSAPVAFNADLLFFPVDVEMFAQSNPVLAGSYRVELYMNGKWKGKHDIHFKQLQDQDHGAHACFDQNLLDVLGIDPRYINAGVAERLAAGEAVCDDVANLVDGASYTFDLGDLRLDVSAPQLVMLRQARGYVDPSRWDAGITALILNYNYNGWHSRQADAVQTSHYLGLRGGINLGDWRVRYRGTIQHSTGTGLRYHGDTLTLERALPGLQGRLTIGDTTSDARIIGGVSIRGIVLGSDERMRPDSMNGFAPVVRGIAQSNAKVTIHQRDTQIFEMTVPPGPFVIDDLYANSNGGDLLVTVTEADGSVHSFTVTYSSLPELLRPGVTRYSAALGQYRSRDAHYRPRLATATVSHGLNNTVTAYGGVMVAQGYQAATVGAGLNLPIGAVTLDASYAKTSDAGQSFHGVGMRLAYTKNFVQSNTDFSLTLARYASKGYYEPDQAFELINDMRRGNAVQTRDKPRSQLSLNLSQTLPGSMGSLSFSGSMQDYWYRRRRDVQYALGYGRSLGSVGASLTASRSRNLTTGRWDNQVLVNFSIPLDPTPPARQQSYMNSSYAYRREGHAAQTSVSATLGDVDQYHYNIYVTADKNTSQATHVNGGASLGWSTRVARMGANVSVSAGGRHQIGASAAGGMVVFKDGVVFSPQMGDTVGIVQARHATGATIPNATGARLDSRGHAVVPHLQAYRENTVEVDPRGISTDVELMNTSQKVAPTAGAVVLLKYKTQHGYSVLVTGRKQDGSFLPFAAGVLDAAGKHMGYMGQGGQALLRVEETQGVLQVRWGAGDDAQCSFRYDLGEQASTDAMGGFRRMDVVCL